MISSLQIISISKIQTILVVTLGGMQYLAQMVESRASATYIPTICQVKCCVTDYKLSNYTKINFPPY